MSKQRKIIHVDMDCFYVAVEMRDKNLDPNRPYAVGGSPEGRGVISTANYKAREFGVRSAVPASQAIKLCPRLVILKHHFEKYRSASQKIRKIFSDYTSLIQPLSLDEAYLDVSDSSQHQGSASLIAQEIRDRIFKELQLTASAGIAPNKFLAKVASDWNKPNGQYTITPTQITSFVKQLPVSKIPGVGKVTNQKMQNLGIHSCLDLQRYTMTELSYHFGQWGPTLYNLCRGLDDRAVRPSSARKSLSVERTFNKDLTDIPEILERLPSVYEEFQNRLQGSDIPEDKIKSIYTKLTFCDFKKTTKEIAFHKNLSVRLFEELITEAFLRQEKPVRLLGLGVRLDYKNKARDRRQLNLTV